VMSPGRLHLQQRNERHRTTKVILVQVTLYLLASVIGLVPTMLRVTKVLDPEAFAVVDRIILVFLPLQGFFNFVIFVSHKVYNYRRVNRNASSCYVLGLLFQGSANDPTLISRISLVYFDEQDKNDSDGDPHIAAEGDHDKQHQRAVDDNSDPAKEDFHFRLELYRNQALSEELSSDKTLDSKPQDNEERFISTTNIIEYNDASVEESYDLVNNQQDPSWSLPSNSSMSHNQDAEESSKKRKYYKITT